MRDKDFALTVNVDHVLGSELRRILLSKVKVEESITKRVLVKLVADKVYPVYDANTISNYIKVLVNRGLLRDVSKKNELPILTLSAEGEKVLRKIKKMRKEW